MEKFHAINAAYCINICTKKVPTNLKEVTETPVPQHLKESVVVGVLADIVQIIVLSPCPDTLLGVDNSPQFGKFTVGVDGSKEDWLKLEGMGRDKREKRRKRKGRGGGRGGVRGEGGRTRGKRGKFKNYNIIKSNTKFTSN